MPREAACRVTKTPDGVPTAHSETEETDDQNGVLQIREDADFGTDPADEQKFKEQTHDADQEQGERAPVGQEPVAGAGLRE